MGARTPYRWQWVRGTTVGTGNRCQAPAVGDQLSESGLLTALQEIDQSFVADIDPQPHSAPLVRAVIAMGKSLGCRVVAEGVETKQQFAYLRAENCDEGQGFHFSPPVNAATFSRLLSNAPFALPVNEN